MKRFRERLGILFGILLLQGQGPAYAADLCHSAALALQVLGSGGPEADDGRASTGYLVWRNGRARVLVDFGGGASLRFEQSGARVEDLRAIAFTHLHVDHSGDFPALIKAAYFSERKQALPVFGPPGNAYLPSMQAFVKALFAPSGAWPYLQDFLSQSKRSDASFRVVATTVDAARDKVKTVFSEDGIQLGVIRVHHGPLPALAWRIDTEDGSITISGDMNGEYAALPLLAKQTDLLVAHHAIPEGASGVARSLHMPPSVIAGIANSAKPGQLVLSHRMMRTLGREDETRGLIRREYDGEIHFADDLGCFVVK